MLGQTNTLVLLTLGTLMSSPAFAGTVPFFFTTGAPDGRLGAASRPGPSPEIEAADDFFTLDGITTLTPRHSSDCFRLALPSAMSPSSSIGCFHWIRSTRRTGVFPRG
jgi:hypothetical protein